MCVWRAHHDRVGLAGQVEIVAIAATAGQEAQILAPPDRLPDPGTCRRSVHQPSLLVVLRGAQRRSNPVQSASVGTRLLRSARNDTRVTMPGRTGSICPTPGFTSPCNPG